MTLQSFQVKGREKLSSFLQKRVGGSGKQIRRVLEANGCRVNGKIERFASVELSKGDLVEFSAIEKPKQSVSILFESDSFFAIDKPSGWECSPLVCQKHFGPSVHLVHRLDKETTGILLIAKNQEALSELSLLFKERKMEKTYEALVDGVIRKDQGEIKGFLALKKTLQGQKVWGSASQGLWAETEWEVMGRGENITRVQCRPKTGRMHQLRVHLFEMGHPILGDRHYAERFRSPLMAARILLHARFLRFSFRGSFFEIEAPLPLDMVQMAHAGQLF